MQRNMFWMMLGFLFMGLVFAYLIPDIPIFQSWVTEWESLTMSGIQKSIILIAIGLGIVTAIVKFAR